METESNRTSFLTPAVQGIIIPNVLAAIVLAIIFAVGRAGSDTDTAANIGMTAFFAVPIVMGVISAYFWRDLEWSAWLYMGYSAINFGIILILATVVAQEGMFCLLIVSPLIYLELLIGAGIGKLIFRRRNTMLSSSMVGILALFILFDLVGEHNYRNAVVDTVVINASPEQVWKYVAATPRNDSPSEWWFFNIGLPHPVETTVSEFKQGAKRACVFSNGVVFDEVMSVYEPNRELTFDIVKQPEDPEIIGHITMDRGQFLLRDNGDGTTTLTGTSWYRLHVYPAWYFDLWAEAITRNVHIHAMKHIKRLAERGSDDVSAIRQIRYIAPPARAITSRHAAGTTTSSIQPGTTGGHHCPLPRFQAQLCAWNRKRAAVQQRIVVFQPHDDHSGLPGTARRA